MDERAQTDPEDRGETQNEAIAHAFTQIEHWITIGIGAVLILATLLLLSGTLAGMWQIVRQWPATDNIFLVVDKLLFVLMMVEILHTVRQSITSDQIAVEPFLIVGLIASVRRILIVTVEVANLGKSNAEQFNQAMIELGVLGMLTLVLIISIYLSRKSRKSNVGI